LGNWELGIGNWELGMKNSQFSTLNSQFKNDSQFSIGNYFLMIPTFVIEGGEVNIDHLGKTKDLQV
jgi:hypothetical protein